MGAKPEWVIRIVWRYRRWDPILTIGKDTLFTGRWKERADGTISVEVQHSFYREVDSFWGSKMKKNTQIRWVDEEDIIIERIFSCGN